MPGEKIPKYAIHKGHSNTAEIQGNTKELKI